MEVERREETSCLFFNVFFVRACQIIKIGWSLYITFLIDADEEIDWEIINTLTSYPTLSIQRVIIKACYVPLGST